jgi:hypothetical protein
MVLWVVHQNDVSKYVRRQHRHACVCLDAREVHLAVDITVHHKECIRAQLIECLRYSSGGFKGFLFR